MVGTWKGESVHFGKDGSLVLFAPFNFEFPKLDFDLCAARRWLFLVAAGMESP